MPIIAEDKGRYQILLTSDVLAEGVNLHRSNVIVNYDSPWNATRLMQRIGRVNRIGSVAPEIHNYMFYPSSQGDKEIQLYKNALIKLQASTQPSERMHRYSLERRLSRNSSSSIAIFKMLLTVGLPF